MTAKQEINNWLEEHRGFSTEAEKEAFYDKIRLSLTQKDQAGLQEGLLALKEAVHALNKKVDEQIKETSIEVFPKDEADIAMLKTLFKRLNIRYRISA